VEEIRNFGARDYPKNRRAGNELRSLPLRLSLVVSSMPATEEAGALGPWSYGAMGPWSYGSMELWVHGAMGPWSYGAISRDRIPPGYVYVGC
jgi:hypothetical protein